MYMLVDINLAVAISLLRIARIITRIVQISWQSFRNIEEEVHLRSPGNPNQLFLYNRLRARG